MTERLLLVSTCGTSLFSNGASDADRAWLTEVANNKEVEAARLTPIVEDRRARLDEADESTRRKMSAELNGIGAVLDRYRPVEIFHVLVHTDTKLGRSAAELVQASLSGTTSLLSGGGLRTDDPASFRAALPIITKELDQLIEGSRRQGWLVLFNLTGGFKSLNGYLQTMGMILADRCVFIFESAPELMEIPRLPVRLFEADDLRTDLETFRRLDVGYEVRSDEAQNIPEALLMEVDGKVVTSVYGDLVWSRHRSVLLGAQLQKPLSTKVRIAEAVRKKFDSLQEPQRVQVNEALDEFSAHVDHNRPLLSSRTFKKLQGDPVPGSTHELYAWSDGAAGRLFGHAEGDGVFVFDRLDKHL